MDFGKSCISIYGGNDANSSDHCLSGNIFYGFALNVIDSTISSCAHPQLSASSEYQQCLTESGAFVWDDIDKDYTNIMIATSIRSSVINVSNSNMMLDKLTINTTFTNEDNYNPFSIGSDSILLFLDMTITEDITLEFPNGCTSKCFQTYQNSPYEFHQLHVYCGEDITDNAAAMQSVFFYNVSSVNYTLPHQLFLNSSSAFYPGKPLDISYDVMDLHGNIISDWNGELSLILSSTDFSFETTMTIKRDGSGYKCDICDTGLFIQNARLDELMFDNTSYTIMARMKNDALFVNNLTVIVSECPSGFGLNEISSHCQECNIGEFSIEASRLPCKSCNNVPLTEIQGIDCNGGNSIIISQNYWVGINHSSSYDIVSKHCPSNYCAQRQGNYLALRSSNELCANGRDKMTPLCGKCIDGLTELYGSANCGECDTNAWWLWILYAIYSALLTLLFIIIYGIRQTKPPQEKPINPNKGKTITEEGSQYIRRAIFKVLVYYYQSLAFIFLNSDVYIHLMAFVDLLSLQSPLDSNTGINGFCWIDGLSARGEIMLTLIIPTFCALTLIIMGVIYEIKPYKVAKRTPYFIKASVGILLLFIGSISGICFKLIACRDIDNKSVHFYFGSDECYDRTWYLSLSVLILLVGLFCSFFLKLFMDHRNDETRKLMKTDEYVLSSFVRAYDLEKYYFWEVVMFLRRLIIAMINVLTDSNYTKNTLFIIMLVFLFLQFNCNPFQIKEVNSLESICLGCLLATLYILSNNFEDSLSVITLNIILLAPFIMFLIQFWMINSRAKKDASAPFIAVAISNSISLFCLDDCVDASFFALEFIIQNCIKNIINGANKIIFNVITDNESSKLLDKIYNVANKHPKHILSNEFTSLI